MRTIIVTMMLLGGPSLATGWAGLGKTLGNREARVPLRSRGRMRAHAAFLAAAAAGSAHQPQMTFRLPLRLLR